MQTFFLEAMRANTPMKTTKSVKKTSISTYIKTASFYGFSSAITHVKDFTLSKTDITKGKNAAEKVALIRLFIEKKMSTLPQPAMIYYKTLLPDQHTFNLDIIGNPKSIADAILIETSYIIAKEEHTGTDISVELNTLGDRESMKRLERELQSFYRKNWSSVPKSLQPIYKKDIFESFRATEPVAVDLRMLGPDPIRCLSEHSRLHFKEVLDYIENLGIPYSINHSLLGDPSFGSETVFVIISTNSKGERKIIAKGQRYNSVAKKFFNKKEIPSIGSEICIKKETFTCECDPTIKEIKPKFFFIQLSFEAKLQSLQLLETLRKARMGVFQSLTKDKMTAQLSQAEKMEIPYVIIMGKKEALDGTVLVRNMETRCQDTVYLHELIDYIKKLK